MNWKAASMPLLLLILFLSSSEPYACSYDSLTDMEIKVDPIGLEMQLGELASLEVTIIILHSNCPLDIDDTDIMLPDVVELTEETDWAKTESNAYQKTLTLEAIAEGGGYIIIRRDCPRYGLLEKKVPIIVGEGALPPSIDANPPEFVWSEIRDMKLTEIAQYYDVPVSDILSALGLEGAEGMTAWDIKRTYGISNEQLQSALEDLYSEYHQAQGAKVSIDTELYLRDYVFIVLMAASIVLFFLGKHKLRYITLASALLYFGFYEGGCMCHVGAIGNLFLRNVSTIRLHWIVLVFVPILTSVVFGRVFCGWVCLFGALQQFVYDLRKRLFPKMKPLKAPRSLHLLKFAVLFIVIYYAYAISRQIYCDYDPFLYIFTLSFSWGIVGALAILLLTSSFLIERPFCRFVCPLGAILWASERIPLLRVRTREGKCNSCGICNRVCPMDKDIPNGKGECICCGECLRKCRKGALYYGHKE